MASIPIEVDICPDTHPGVATSNQELGLTIYFEYTLYCPINLEKIELKANHLEKIYWTLNAKVVKCVPNVF